MAAGKPESIDVPFHPPPRDARRPRVFYGWVCAAVAALAMVATLPGRTIGLGAVTEPILRDLALTRSQFGVINLVATFAGAAFCLGVGRAIDRLGARAVCTVVAGALAIVVIATAAAGGYWSLLAAVTLTRGLGQSALSVVSIAIVGKWFVRRIGPAMGAYTVALSIGFMAAVPALEYAMGRAGWRAAWSGMGWLLLVGFVPLAALLLRDTPESIGLRADGDDDALGGEAGAAAGDDTSVPADNLPDYTLGAAMRTGTFWALASCGFSFAAFFNGFVLFRESVLAERGFDAATALPAVAALTLAGLVANVVAGWSCRRQPMGRVAGISMLLLAAGALLLPVLRTPAQAVACASLIGLGGGGVTVVFFAAWSHAFGRRHLGRIQGAAQLLTVLGSAIGPLLLAESHARFGSYAPLFRAAAPVLAGAGLWAWSLGGGRPRA